MKGDQIDPTEKLTLKKLSLFRVKITRRLGGANKLSTLMNVKCLTKILSFEKGFDIDFVLFR